MLLHVSCAVYVLGLELLACCSTWFVRISLSIVKCYLLHGFCISWSNGTTAQSFFHSSVASSNALYLVFGIPSTIVPQKAFHDSRGGRNWFWRRNLPWEDIGKLPITIDILMSFRTNTWKFIDNHLLQLFSSVVFFYSSFHPNIQ